MHSYIRSSDLLNFPPGLFSFIRTSATCKKGSSRNTDLCLSKAEVQIHISHTKERNCSGLFVNLRPNFSSFIEFVSSLTIGDFHLNGICVIAQCGKMLGSPIAGFVGAGPKWGQSKAYNVSALISQNLVQFNTVKFF